MTDANMIARHDRAYELAKGCKVYAPGNPTPPDALMHATRSGQTSAHCANEWMMLYRQMKANGLKSEKHAHLFRGYEG